MSKTLLTVFLLCISNIFMTFAWYGHLTISKKGWLKDDALWKIILISWGLAFIEYCFAVPANRIGSQQRGGPLSLFQLKTLQEVISLAVFTLMVVYVFKSEKPTWNHALAFLCLLGAVYFVFKK
jgi:uncharacterized protein (DUF486 family)